MKALRVLGAALLVIAGSTRVDAQTPVPPSPIARWDVTGTLGWFNANKSDASRESYNDWYNSSLYGGLGVGWYWTDHHKTELDFGATTGGDIYATTRVVVDRQVTYTTSRLLFDTRRLTLAQHYQAFRNAWFHPHVAAGIDLTWETTREQRDPTIIWDEVTRTPREVLPARTIAPDQESIVRPFAAAGFKAYMTQRAFFRSDLRLTFKGGVDEALLRFGFGMDF